KSDTGSSKGSGKKTGSRPLPVARPLDAPPSDKKSLSGPNVVVKADAAGKPATKPVAKSAGQAVSGPMRAVATTSQRAPQASAAKKSKSIPVWIWIAGSAAAIVVLGALAVGLVLLLR